MSQKPSKWQNTGEEKPYWLAPNSTLLRSRRLRLSGLHWLTDCVHAFDAWPFNRPFKWKEKQACVYVCNMLSIYRCIGKMRDELWPALYHLKLVIFIHFKLNYIHFSPGKQTIKAELFSFSLLKCGLPDPKAYNCLVNYLNQAILIKFCNFLPL